MSGKQWNQSQRESLIAQVKLGRTLPQIHIRGRSQAAVNQQRQRLRNLGLLDQPPKRSVRMWTIREIRALEDYCNRYRLSAAEIVKRGLMPGRSKDSLSQQMKRQGLGDPERRRGASTARRLSAEQRVELERFLQAEGRKMASREVASRFRLSPNTITAYRRRLKLRLSWHDARDSAGFRQRQAEVREAAKERSRAYWVKWRVERRQTLRRLEQRLKRLGASERGRQCFCCRESWLSRNEFFSLTKRTRRGRTTFTMSLVCRACRIERRR